ncbi:MAG: 2-phosphosulfolactate phosphatase family protein [Gemmatimonadota bacterium]|nr:MAG: 2-phosphosulfolactate phosphatase family protein [Gemmatimonadota bacterium]
MKVDVLLSAAEAEGADFTERTVLVVDVLRATSTMVEALANGARAIYPTSSAEEALKLASSLGREDTLLCGERKGLMIEGYALGNSPGEFEPERVEDKQLVMNTTNGTPAFLAVESAPRVYAGSLMNLGAVSRAVVEASTESLMIVCAGRRGRLSLEDLLCAGLILRRVAENSGGVLEANDAARVAKNLAGSVQANPEFLSNTDGGRMLDELGFAEDLVLCSEIDRHDVVPVMIDRSIVLDDPSGG